MNPIILAVREFAIPVPRVGSIDLHSGFGQAAAEGQEIHLRVQERRLKSDSNYQSEVKISQDFEKDGFLFRIGGRIDGLFDKKQPKIEEIKTTLNINDLFRKLAASPNSHPYCLQLRTYGYFFWLQNKVIPNLTFHLVSTRNQESEDLEIQLDLSNYEDWLEQRLSELVKEAKVSENRVARRREAAVSFAFPFELPRPGQTGLIQSIEEGISERVPMLFQAPTGLGKTVGVLFPLLKEAMIRGQNVIYVTPKNSQHLVAEDAVKRFQNSGADVKSLTITAKSKICFKNEPICNPEYCEYAKDYYKKVYENDLPTLLMKKNRLGVRDFREIGEEYQVCPFELQLEVAPEADTIICDYNYVFAPGSPLERMRSISTSQVGKPNLVIDEFHNLPFRAMDYYSPMLSTVTLEKLREDLQQMENRFADEAEELLNQCIQVVLSCKPKEDSGAKKIEPSVDSFLEQDLVLRKFMSRYLDSNVEIRPKDAILRLCFYWSEFTAALDYVAQPDHTEFFMTYHPHSMGGSVKITCCDASKKLKPCYKNYEQVVGFSATVKPFEYYAKLTGLDIESLKTAEFPSPFQKGNRKLMIIPQISTKYSARERSYPRVAETVSKIASLKKGNYFVFFPSFVFMEKVLEVFSVPDGFTVLKQERELKNSEFLKFIEHLRGALVPTLVFAVQGGVFSEGVDYPGDMIIGAFVVGPPLPNFDLEREEMRKYYDENYGSGFNYAYTFPAMAKAIQAAGRVIRSEEDRGLIVLIDNRFIQNQYSQSMPSDWFNASPLELVSKSILKDVAEFWNL